jgi:hypothetical protein
MGKFKFYLMMFSLFLLLPVIARGQSSHEMFISAPTTADDFLNNHIMGDTTATGERVDPERVYVLERGGYYYVNSTLNNNGWVLRMKAEDGDGPRPYIIAVRNASTQAVTNLMQVRSNIWLKNLVLSGYDDSDTSTVDDMQGYLIQTSSAGWDVVIDSCVLTNSSGNHIRTNSAARVVKVTNSIFANMGSLYTSNLGAGKAIDLRAGSCDTLLLQNNTFVNFQDRLVRHYNSTAPLNYMLFDHNTIVNGMSYHGMLSLGITGDKIEITNNLLVDPFALGSDTDATRQAEFESGELDENGLPRMSWIFSVPNDSTEWVVSNNYYSISEAGQAFFDAHNAEPGFAGNEGAPLSHHINSKLGADSVNAFMKEDIVLGDTPDLMVNFLEWYRDPDGGNKEKGPGNFSRADDFDRKNMEYFNGVITSANEDTLDCTYSTSSPAYTGSMTGGPVGDLNWFKSGIGIKEIPYLVARSYSLQQNYPNPFNPSTVIRYSIPENAHVTLKVYNLLGQEIATLVNGEQKASTYEVTFDASKFATGIYFYTVKAGNYSNTKKMMLVK